VPDGVVQLAPEAVQHAGGAGLVVLLAYARASAHRTHADVDTCFRRLMGAAQAGADPSVVAALLQDPAAREPHHTAFLVTQVIEAAGSEAGAGAVAALLQAVGGAAALTSEQRVSLLRDAVRRNRPHVTAALLTHGCGAGDLRRGHILALACRQGCARVAELCFAHGLTAEDVCGSGMEPLRLACKAGHLQVAEVLLQQAVPAAAIQATPLLLTHACRTGNLALVKLLMRAGDLGARAIAHANFSALRAARQSDSQHLIRELQRVVAQAPPPDSDVL
jgi:hypothetical protein